MKSPSTTLRFGRLLQTLFQQQARDVLNQLRRVDWEDGEEPDLTHWNIAIAEAVQPLYLSAWQQGVVTTAGRIGMRLTQPTLAAQGVIHGEDGMRTYLPGNNVIFGKAARVRGSAGDIRHSLEVREMSWTGSPRSRPVLYRKSRWVVKAAGVDVDFDLFNPRVIDAVDAATMQFCRETNETATDKLKVSLDQLRQLLRLGLARGDALRLLAREVVRIFAIPQRAYMIAATEGSRAVHGGQLMAAKESGVVNKKQWLASSDSCDACLELDSKEVALDKPFWVDPKGGPYAVVMFPPLHPSCFCDFTEVLGRMVA